VASVINGGRLKSGVLSTAPPFKKNAHGLYGNWTCRFVREIRVGVFGS